MSFQHRFQPNRLLPLWRSLAAGASLSLLTACGLPIGSRTLDDSTRTDTKLFVMIDDAGPSSSSQRKFYFSAPEDITSFSHCVRRDAKACQNETDFVADKTFLERDGRKFFVTENSLELVHKQEIVMWARGDASDIKESIRFIDAEAPKDPEPKTEKPNPKVDESGTFAQRDGYFALTAYFLPSPDQLGAGSCLYMAGTGIMEFLLNKSKGIKAPALGGDTDISEQMTLTLASQLSVKNPYTDVVFLISQWGGYVLDKDLYFPAYADGSRWISGTGVNLQSYQKHTDLPDIGRDVIFDGGGEGTQRTNRLMNDKVISDIKAALVKHRSPVLYVYQPDGVNYWHANFIVGYEDAKNSFIVRDSSFGQKREDLPKYVYGNQSPWGPQFYRDTNYMSYTDVKTWGNHASVYYLK